MLKSDVSRNSGNRSSRNVGEAPNIGKVPRSPQSGIRYKDSGARQKAKHNRQRTIRAWSVLFTLITIGVVIGFSISYIKKSEPTPKANTRILSDDPDFDGMFAEKSALATSAPGEKDSLDIVTNGLQASNAEAISRYFRLPDGETPETALEILKQTNEKDGEVVKLDWGGTRFSNGIIIEQVVVLLRKDERKVNRLAQLLPDENGDWKIDFDSYVRRVFPDWKTILAGDSPVSTVRIFASADTYYNGAFSDDSIWQCYMIASPDVEEILYAYAKRGSAQNIAMEKILSREETTQRIALQIRKLPESGNRQFQISRVLAEDWVIRETAFDENL